MGCVTVAFKRILRQKEIIPNEIILVAEKKELKIQKPIQNKAREITCTNIKTKFKIFTNKISKPNAWSKA